jgi:hypothetical protein
VVLIAAFALAVAVPAQPAQIGIICGQIKNGPYASFESAITGVKLKGTT